MNQGKETAKNNVETLINALKCKDKKIRYKALNNIFKLSRSNKTLWKNEFLNLVLSRSSSEDWEERYVAMYAISRFYWKNWDIDEFKKQFLNVFKLIEDVDGRVRIAARNALEHFRTYFFLFDLNGWKIDKKAIVELWKESLFSLWEKIDLLEEGKIRRHLIECIKILYRNDMDAYLGKKDFDKYQDIWDKVNELDSLYYETTMEQYSVR